MRILGYLLLAVSAVLAAATGVQAAPDNQGFSGNAAYYSPNYSGKVASGAGYDPTKFTAAHKTLPFGTRLLVTDLKTRRSVTVIVNDRGPFTPARVIDLSLAAARALKMTGRGIIQVKIVGAADAIE
jgi:rare lipoprotein A